MEDLQLVAVIPHLEEDEKALNKMGVKLYTSDEGLKAWIRLESIIRWGEFAELVKHIGIQADLKLDLLKNKMEQRKHIETGEPMLIADLTANARPIPDAEFLAHKEEVTIFLEKAHDPNPEVAKLARLPLLNVAEGTVIARRFSEEKQAELADLKDVFGLGRDGLRKAIIHYKVGKGVEQGEQEIVATMNGRLDLNDTAISVQNKFLIQHIDDCVDGEVKFFGNVEVAEEVIEHFAIHAGENIRVHGSTESADLTAGGEIIVEGAIAGQGVAKIKAKKLVKAQNVNQAEVFCEHDCEFLSGALHCTVHAHGKLVVDDGPITGGFSYGATGVEAKQLGGSSGVVTTVVAGFCRDVPKSLDIVVEELKEIQGRMKSVSERLQTYVKNPELFKQMNNEDRMRVKAMNQQMKEMKTRYIKLGAWLSDHDLQACEKAKVSVQGIIYPGTFIKINNYGFEVKEEMRHVIFRSDFKMGKLNISPMRGGI